MPLKGMKKARQKYKTIVANVTDKKAKATLTKVIVYAAGASKELAPIEFGNLVNSQFRNVTKTATGWRGTLGYATSYAAILENPKAGGRMDNWKPRPPEQKKGNAWNPRSKQGFLSLAFTSQENSQVIQKILINGLKLK